MAARPGSMRSSKQAMVPDGYEACPVDVAFDIVGKKWNVLLIRNMLRGQRHFNQFLANIPGINPKTLSTRLKELEKARIITKRIEKRSPVSIEYELTPKGYGVVPILRQMVRWSVTWAPERVFAARRPPQDPDRCLEEWQAVVMGKDCGLEMDWKPEIVTVRQGAKRRT